MAIKINQKHEKEIIALNTFEAVRLRPGMYLGQVSMIEEKIPIVRDGKLIQANKIWSPGFMHLIVEILENSIDEAKRMKGKMKNIWIGINLDTNEVSIRDEGGGFHRAGYKHPKTKKNVVRTAFEELHAGSNFIDSSTNILGTHGVGAAICNILSEYFEVNTVNKTHYVRYVWKDYNVIEEHIGKKNSKDRLGTEVTFFPSKEIFEDYKWDKELIETYLSFKQFLININPSFKDLKINVSFVEGGKEVESNITSNFLPDKIVSIDNKEWGTIMLWPAYEDSCSLSFVNGSQCTGIHQKVVNDWINDFFKYNFAHHFYETLISLNVPSALMRFGDQNKSKYDVTRFEIEDLLEENFKFKLIKKLKNSDIAIEIEKEIEDKLYDENIKKIRKAQRISKRKISDKYSPPSRKKEFLYITEGISAAGSIKQARNSEIEGVYALKGKIKNTKKLSDVVENKELLEIMSILNIDPSKESHPIYKNIIIATDEDPDGQHISSLIINFFYKWFPNIIKEGKLFKLITPLVACDYKGKKKYFYSLKEFEKFSRDKKLTNIIYLKGLGSLDIEDWKWVMPNKIFFQIIEDKNSKKLLDIIFGDNSEKRKKWLEV